MRSDLPPAHTKLESHILSEVMVTLGSLQHVRVWRQNVGAARDPVSGRVIHYGLPGMADLSGMVRATTPSGELVGLRLEVEVKSADGRISPKQRTWGAMVERFGGIWLVVRSEDEAREKLASALWARGLTAAPAPSIREAST